MELRETISFEIYRPPPQGVVTGLALAPNGVDPPQGDADPAKQLEELLMLSDWVRYSLAGNLK